MESRAKQTTALVSLYCNSYPNNAGTFELIRRKMRTKKIATMRPRFGLKYTRRQLITRTLRY